MLRSQRVRRHRHFALYGRHLQGLDTSRNLEGIAARLCRILWGGVYLIPPPGAPATLEPLRSSQVFAGPVCSCSLGPHDPV